MPAGAGVVVDTRARPGYLMALAGAGLRVVVIDDLGRGRAAGRPRRQPERRRRETCRTAARRALRFLLGPSYALLRPAFGRGGRAKRSRPDPARPRDGRRRRPGRPHVAAGRLDGGGPRRRRAGRDRRPLHRAKRGAADRRRGGGGPRGASRGPQGHRGADAVGRHRALRRRPDDVRAGGDRDSGPRDPSRRQPDAESDLARGGRDAGLGRRRRRRRSRRRESARPSRTSPAMRSAGRG